MTQKELAAKVGVKQPTLSELETGESAGTTNIASFAAALGVSALWLETGKGPFVGEVPTSIPPGAIPVASGQPVSGRVPIKRYKEVRLSAGLREGFDGELDQRDGGHHYLPTRFIERQNLRPEMLFAVEVEGESMEDTLYEGNLVVVNRADKLPVSGEIYAVNVGDKATIKRLIRKGPSWWLSSDNPNKKAHPDISMAEAQGEVIGKVVWREGGL